ncbi:PIR protein [Plasmodium yoelii]|uniref:PIR protein n=2 Tax=Plasmodium yoelii TaxID=5861 RepID=A0AAF0B0U9_PLAYO|nr:PIR protein [Plasmodium yoelii]WBY58242.1 PIR protein [Plasmodium yoelii yoelii]CDU85267.1 YIR protein [Plasmodium yoelii]VTZ79162.1 PIR protein [Plasmodium yoelii]|eukprot:XP_022813427.1 PIR protein [Plasmodium yoelii]
MDDSLCGKFGFLRTYLPDDLSITTTPDFFEYSKFKNYCPNEDCNTDLDKITIGFLWLLEQYFTISLDKSYNENNTKPFFLYIILWLSYKLNKNTEHNATKINDFYIKHVNENDKYKKFRDAAYTYTDLEEFINKQNELLNIDIKDLSNFYDASKLICSMYGNVAQGQTSEILSNNVNEFINKYTELNNKYNNEDAPHRQILSALSTDYNNLNKKCSNIPYFSEITSNMYALKSGDTSSSSSIGNKLFTVVSIFGAIAFFLGISYKYSLFGFRKRFKKQQIREKIKNIKKKMNY